MCENVKKSCFLQGIETDYLLSDNVRKYIVVRCSYTSIWVLNILGGNITFILVVRFTYIFDMSMLIYACCKLYTQ